MNGRSMKMRRRRWNRLDNPPAGYSSISSQGGAGGRGEAGEAGEDEK